jgi:Glycosyltransferase family 87
MVVVEGVGIAAMVGSRGVEGFVLVADLRAFLGAADMAAAGAWDSLYDLDAQVAWQQRRFPSVDRSTLLVFANPPFVARLLEPLAGRSTSAAYGLVLVANLLLLLASLRLVYGALDGLEPAARRLLLLGILSFVPVSVALMQGQLSPLLLLGVTGGWVALRRGRGLRGGLALSLLLVKPQLLAIPALFLVAHRRGWALLGLTGGSLLWFGLGVSGAGLDGHRAWARLGSALVEGGHAYGIDPKRMYTLRSALHVLAGSDAFDAVRGPWLAGSLAVVAALLWTWRRPASERAFDLRYGATLVASVLLSLHAYVHDLVILIPAAAALAAAALEDDEGPWKRFALSAVGALWLGPGVAGVLVPAGAMVLVLAALLVALMWGSARTLVAPSRGPACPAST